MRVLHSVLVLAVVFGVSGAAAQDSDKPKDKPPAWWMAKPDADAKAPAEAKRDVPKPEGEKDKEAKRDAPHVVLPPQRMKNSSPPRVRATARVVKLAPRERLVYRLANMPCHEVASSINKLLESEAKFSGENTTLVIPEVVTNSLIISGTPDAIHETVKLVEQFDVAPQMVCVQVVIGLMESSAELSLLAADPDGPNLSCSYEEACELIEKYSKSGAVKVLARPQVTTLNNQAAFIQAGQRVPTLSLSKDGAVAKTDMQNVGIIIGLTPRIAPDQSVTMEVDIEKSEVNPNEPGVPLGVDNKGNVILSPKIDTMTLQTTVKTPPRQATIVGGMALQDGDKRGELVFVIMPHIVEP